jgi:integrase
MRLLVLAASLPKGATSNDGGHAMSVRKRTWKNSKGEKKEAWIVDYRDQQGARRIHTFARKEDADEYHATIKVNVRQGVHTAPSKT